MMLTLLVSFCFGSEESVDQLCYNEELTNLREGLVKQAKSEHLNYYDPKFILSGNLCRFTGRTHGGYVYSAIQTLFADDLFFKRMIMDDFKKNQDVCKIFQRIAMKMYGKDAINIEDEVKELIYEKDSMSQYDRHDKNTYYLHLFLISHLCVLNSSIEETIIPELLGLKRKTIAYCYYKVCKRNIWFRDEITNEKKNIQKEITDWIKRTEKSVELCDYCAPKLKNDPIEFCIASRFNLEVKQIINTQKSIFGINKVFHQIEIRGVKYTLYAVLCEYKYSGDNELFHYNLILKGQDWYKFSNEEVHKIDIESGDILDCIVSKMNNDNAHKTKENENKDINFEMLIYYYRRIN